MNPSVLLLCGLLALSGVFQTRGELPGTNTSPAAGSPVLGASTLFATSEPDGLANAEVTLAITLPQGGSTYAAGAPVLIQATAVSLSDGVYRLEFLDGPQVIGTSEILTLVAIPPGEPIQHEYLWVDAPVGRHELRVRTTRNGIAVLSEPVVVEVGDVPAFASVALLQPVPGSRFVSPKSIELIAVALDPDGIGDVVEFLADGEVVGTSRLDFCPPCPNPPLCPAGPCILPPLGVAQTHRLVWENPKVGKHDLVARILRPDGTAVVSSSVSITVDPSDVAVLSWESPAEGSSWPTPGEIPLILTAVDPIGEIRRVEFFANDTPIGISEILTRDVEIPGRPRTHQFAWTNPPPGVQAMKARALSDSGEWVESDVRKILVEGDAGTPWVSVEIVDGSAVEGGRTEDGKHDTLRFRVQRTGGLQSDLQVYLHLEGGSEAGADYPVPPSSIRLAAGESSADLVIEPLDDKKPEERESVVVVLDPSPAQGPVDPYRIDEARRSAVGFIEDDEATLVFLTPRNLAWFALGDPIPIRVSTRWPEGILTPVEFLADGVRIGDSVLDFAQLPFPGTVWEHEFLWKEPGAGTHQLSVRSVLPDGTVVESSESVTVVVGDPGDRSIVSLELTQGTAVEPGASPVLSPGISVTVRRSGDVRGELSVALNTSGTASPLEDYVLDPPDGVVIFQPHQKEALLTVLPQADGIHEGEETVRIGLDGPRCVEGGACYLIGKPDAVEGVLRDAVTGEIPVVTVRTRLPYALEGDRFNRGEFTLHRTGDVSQSLTVSFEVAGVAVRGLDYLLVADPCDDCLAPDQELTGNQVTFPAGGSTVAIGVLAALDGLPQQVERNAEKVEFLVSAPVIPAVLGAVPPYLAGTPDRAVVSVIERRNPAGPEVVLVEPEEGAVLPLGVPQLLRAIAVDPHGSFRRVEFLGNGARIGVSEIVTDEVDVPGRLRVHTVEWVVSDAAQSGPYALTAVAGGVVSGVVSVTVDGGGQELPVVTLAAGKSPAFETGDLKNRLGGFVLQRQGAGDLNLPLTVFVLVSGSATQGADYLWHGFSESGIPEGLPFFGPILPVTFGPGQSESPLEFEAVADDLMEGRETVVLELIQPPIVALGAPVFPGIPAFYRIGNPGSAEVVIEDGNLQGPAITLNEPSDGAWFLAGAVVPITATAIRPDAGVEFIQFLADGKVIGTVFSCCDAGTDCDCSGAPVGQAFTARFEWKAATPGIHVLTARTVVSLNQYLESAPVTISVGELALAKLNIVSPAEGAEIPIGVPVIIDALGEVPGALVGTVEFFANGQKIGESCFLCVVDAIFPPGTPLNNRIEWTPTQPGTYLLTAVGEFVAGAGAVGKVTSPPVTIQVVKALPGPRLTVIRPQEGEQVPAGKEFPVVVVGVGREGGITEVRLLADGEVVGESRLVFLRPPGADEEVRHEFSIRLKPGVRRLVAQDLQDPAVVSRPVTVVAGDSAAAITWVAPEEGAVVPAGVPIPLEVQAVDPEGLLFVVEFLDGDTVIGISEFSCITCRFAPGATIPHRFLWQGATPGDHVLTARAIRADGTVVTSAPRRITIVGDPPPRLFVTRDLPEGYLPGQAFKVVLTANPDPATRAYVVEDQPPFVAPPPFLPGATGPFWRVSSVSGDGVFDPNTGRVKFGPFFDHEPRTLSYEVVADLAVEVAVFDGVGIADGVTTPIGGDRELQGTPRHPADLNAANDRVTGAELTAYAAAWKQEQPWPVGPNPIPVDFVTRAVALWKGGELYRFDAGAGAPPFCWVNGPFPVQGPAFAAVSPGMAGCATRNLGTLDDGSLRVTILVTPAPGVRAFAVEETVHSGGKVVSATQGGVVGSSGRTIRWGPFASAEAMELSYVLASADSGVRSTGLASFDGQNLPVYAAPPASEVNLPYPLGVDPLHDGAVQVTLPGAAATPESSFELQVSTDLVHWTAVDLFTGGPHASFARDAVPAGSTVRFYRAVPR